MKMAGFRLLLLLLMLACIVEVAMANLGPGYPDLPTTSYGPKPSCYLNGAVVNCEWYGYAHLDYPVDGRTCLAYVRAFLLNTTLVPPGRLRPNLYYTLDVFIFNTTTQDAYCFHICLSGAGTPPVGAGPPPATVATPPPAALAAPPPVTITAPPPAPTDSAPPPVLLAPPPTNTPGALAPTTVTPPPPPPPPLNTRVVIAGAGFLQPRGILSFVISGALLVLHGILGF